MVTSQWGGFHSFPEEGPGWPSQTQGLWGAELEAQEFWVPPSSEKDALVAAWVGGMLCPCYSNTAEGQSLLSSRILDNFLPYYNSRPWPGLWGKRTGSYNWVRAGQSQNAAQSLLSPPSCSGHTEEEPKHQLLLHTTLLVSPSLLYGSTALKNTLDILWLSNFGDSRTTKCF